MLWTNEFVHTNSNTSQNKNNETIQSCSMNFCLYCWVDFRWMRLFMLLVLRGPRITIAFHRCLSTIITTFTGHFITQRLQTYAQIYLSLSLSLLCSLSSSLFCCINCGIFFISWNILSNCSSLTHICIWHTCLCFGLSWGRPNERRKASTNKPEISYLENDCENN